jgi:delta-aminolevulinic acid dehydratase/porphobilinogen synthase
MMEREEKKVYNEYTSHGHCGILCGQDVDNDKTLEYSLPPLLV